MKVSDAIALCGAKLREIHERTDRITECPVTPLRRAVIFGDIVLCKLIYGSDIVDYYIYQFYRKTFYERNNYITGRRVQRLYALDRTKDDNVLKDKVLFNKSFADLIGRDWLYLPESDFEQFRDFLNRHPSFMIKPPDGGGGRGITRHTLSEGEDIRALYEALRAEGAMVEEVLTQHAELARINPTSINTVRTYTANMDGKITLLTCILRVGAPGAVIDNFTSGGYAAGADLKTGLLVTKGYSKNDDRTLVHPGSGVPFCGFQIPCWDACVQASLAIAARVPQFHYCAWDLCVRPDGRVSFVEGNVCGGTDATQAALERGLWRQYKQAFHL